MGVKRQPAVGEFSATLRRFHQVGLDSAVLIYHFEDVPPYSGLTAVAIAGIAGGQQGGVVSTVALAEILVKPFARGHADKALAVEDLILTIPNCTIAPVDVRVAREAARLRARHGLRMPDALSAATALVHKAGAYLTNDRRLSRLQAEGITVLVLDSFLRASPPASRRGR